MYEVTIETHFSSAHRLRQYDGECERLHGHNWDVKVSVASEKLNDLGMVIDFKELKGETNKLMDKFDHQYLNEVPPFTELNPTTENIAKYIFDELSGSINTDSTKVSKVTVWESPTSYASYEISIAQ
ncbi:6-carboxytetrahydropterin synthase QueD [Candidatus Poribacteria bacterium]